MFKENNISNLIIRNGLKVKCQIDRVSKSIFVVSYLHGLNNLGRLTVDFNPFIQRFKLSGNIALLHWQARPKNMRTWGLFNLNDDTYEILLGETQNFAYEGIFTLLELPEMQYNTVPTSVILFNFNNFL